MPWPVVAGKGEDLDVLVDGAGKGAGAVHVEIDVGQEVDLV